MSKEIETLMKIQGKINRSKYHLCVTTDLQNQYSWVLFLYNPKTEDYFSSYNFPILESRIDTIDELFEYLKKHDGFEESFLF